VSRADLIAGLQNRDGDRCFYCEQTFSAYHVDHVQPQSRGGADDVDNYVLACGDCNLAKRDWPAWLHVFYAELGLTLPPNTSRVNFGRYPTPWYEPPAAGMAAGWTTMWSDEYMARVHEFCERAA
jgi:hypothetical protein